jgi:hypothetical protein
VSILKTGLFAEAKASASKASKEAAQCREWPRPGFIKVIAMAAPVTILVGDGQAQGERLQTADANSLLHSIYKLGACSTFKVRYLYLDGRLVYRSSSICGEVFHRKANIYVSSPRRQPQQTRHGRINPRAAITVLSFCGTGAECQGGIMLICLRALSIYGLVTCLSRALTYFLGAAPTETCAKHSQTTPVDMSVRVYMKKRNSCTLMTKNTPETTS